MRRPNLFQLLTQRRFGPFFATLALGAFNDNVFRNALALAVVYHSAQITSTQASLLTNLAAGLFTLPFFLFSALAGQLAERHEKSRLIRRIKLFEVVLMLLAALGFLLGSTAFLIALVFLMGLQSALFGPVKYAILPQQLREDELVGGNGLVSMGTFLAILLGTLCAGVLVAMNAPGQWPVALLVVVVALAGWWASRSIPSSPATAPDLVIDYNPLRSSLRILGHLRGQRTLLLSVLGISWFWLFGAVYLAQLPAWTRDALGAGPEVVTLLLALFSISIACGSLLCERLSGRRVELGLVPFGSIGMTLFGLDLYFATPSVIGEARLGLGEFLAAPGSLRILVDIAGLGLFSGFYIVPLNALVQSRAEPSHRSRVIAANNLLNALFMVLAALLAIGLLAAGLDLAQVLLVVTLMNIAVAAYIYTLVPEFLMRFLVWLLISTLYRIRATGLEHIPDDGPALLVANHVSYVDALLIGGLVRRPVRFVMYHRIYRLPLLNFIFRTAGAIPIAPAKEDPELLEQALQQIDQALAAGQLVGLFPEGAITRDGRLAAFRPGIEKILEQRPVAVIPMAIGNMWGSVFSRRDAALGRARLPRRFWSRVSLTIAPAVPAAQAEASRLEQRIRSMLGEATS